MKPRNIETIKHEGSIVGLRVRPFIGKDFECYFSDFLLFFVKKNNGVALSSQHHLRGSIMISPAEDGEAEVIRGHSFEALTVTPLSASTDHLVGKIVNTLTGHKGPHNKVADVVHQIFTKLDMHFLGNRFLNILEGHHRDSQRQVVTKVANYAGAKLSYQEHYISKTMSLFVELLGSVMDGRVSSPGQWREEGVRIIETIAMANNYQPHERYLIDAMLANKAEFAAKGLTGLCDSKRDILPPDYIASAAYYLGVQPELSTTVTERLMSNTK